MVRAATASSLQKANALASPLKNNESQIHGCLHNSSMIALDSFDKERTDTDIFLFF